MFIYGHVLSWESPQLADSSRQRAYAEAGRACPNPALTDGTEPLESPLSYLANPYKSYIYILDDFSKFFNALCTQTIYNFLEFITNLKFIFLQNKISYQRG